MIQKTPIAVVSMAGIFPGAADTDRFIHQILEKRESVIRVPDGRWIAPPYRMVDPQAGPDRAVSDRAGLITGFSFDPHGFRMDPDLLAALDPLHHLVLSAGRNLVDSGTISDDTRKRTGVILAAIALPTDSASRISWEILCEKAPRPITARDALTASVVSAPAAILARALGFQGGCFTLDAACASSLFAVKLACEHLALGRADAMVAGGVSRPDSLYTQIGFTQLSALSPSGRCAPFDRQADGLVVGEGTGLVVLKRLADARACGDPVLGVIRGYGVSNDIEGNLVGPASEGQLRAMTAAYDMADWRPSDIQYMECHGSGTPVGDKVETASISRLMDRFGCSGSELAIGSVKSNIGHLLTAAGAAGLIKTLGAMNLGVLPPSLNFSAPPDNSPLDDGRIRVQTETADWQPRDGKRKAGISAFGFGGINAHLLLETGSDERRIHALGQPPKTEPAACAIVGMGTLTRDCDSLDRFRDLVFGDTEPSRAPGDGRWRRTTHLDAAEKTMAASFMETINLALGEFHIPPNQMADILPQHLVLLKAAKHALADAGIPPRPGTDDSRRTALGCAVGIEFDFGAADFFLRWNATNLNEAIIDQLGPPLTFNRTLGALGGIVASRVAREFQLGGPCFTLSAGAASGVKAIETGIHSLSAEETDTFICAAVDMAGDIRQFTLNHRLAPFGAARPSEGAAALVMKRLEDAQRDGDRIYAVVRGTGGASGTPVAGESLAGYPADETRYGLPHLPSDLSGLSFIDTHTGGAGFGAELEAHLLETLMKSRVPGTDSFLGWTQGALGDTRSAAGLFSVIKTVLSLFHRTLPACPLPGTSCFRDMKPWSILQKKTDWPAGNIRRRALSSVVTTDGAFAHVLLEEAPEQVVPPRPLENRPAGSPMTLATTKPAIDETVLDALCPASAQPAVPTASGTIPLDPSPTVAASEATARAHETFLDFTRTNMTEMGRQFGALARAAGQPVPDAGSTPAAETAPAATPVDRPPGPMADASAPQPLFDRDLCMEFATGKAGKVLGPRFDIIDTYPVRVRLPDEPLMLVDRILSIDGEPGTLGSGKIVTQHDVQAGAWYLDGGLAPVSISIEAGQADLFLCSYLGIDHAVKGTRKYRLLDARVTFHRSLPRPGETIEYHIEIDRFLKQGDVYLFFFHYKGTIGGEPFISMRDGCAGFFTDLEVENSGGIILTDEDRKPRTPGKGFTPLASVEKGGFSDNQIQRLRKGDLEGAFGPVFSGMTLGRNQRLPGGRMHLIDRVLDLDPTGGRYGLGTITAEADIHPDDWFLTCHFIDDMVMPGTLMYECCAHTLRLFVQRMGWVSPDHTVHYNVLPANESDLKCRGPVTPATQKARYEIEIKEMGYGPEPYVIADAHMFSDDLRIVLYRDMGMKLIGVSADTLKQLWSGS